MRTPMEKHKTAQKLKYFSVKYKCVITDETLLKQRDKVSIGP